MYYLFSYILVYSFWISIAATEGWKWRQDIHKNDDSKVINYKSYHVWRLITNVVPFFIALNGYNLVSTQIGFWYGSLWLLLVNFSGNAAYELVMSYVQEDKWFIDRGDFHIMGITIKRPNVYSGMIFGIICFIASIVLLVVKL